MIRSFSGRWFMIQEVLDKAVGKRVLAYGAGLVGGWVCSETPGHITVVDRDQTVLDGLSEQQLDSTRTLVCADALEHVRTTDLSQYYLILNMLPGRIGGKLREQLISSGTCVVDIAFAPEDALELDEPLNIHMTGCPNSCAQHYVGDIGLLGARVADPDAEDPDEADQVDGFHVYIGGGYEDEEGIARELATSIPVVHLNAYLENLLGLYLDERHHGERFVAYARRQDIDELKQRLAEHSEKAAVVQRESEEKAYAEAEAKADTPEQAKTARDKAAQDDYDRQPAETKNTA